MSIVIEEGKKGMNIVSLLGWVGFLVVIGAAVYYIFFSAPELVVIPPTGTLSVITPIAHINLHPEDVVNSASFQSLKSTISEPSPQAPAAVGRQNPFLSP